MSSGPEDTEQFLNESEQVAYEAAEQRWLGIQTVAEVLVTRVDLLGVEVKQIITYTYGPFEELMGQQRDRV